VVVDNAKPLESGRKGRERGSPCPTIMSTITRLSYKNFDVGGKNDISYNEGNKARIVQGIELQIWNRTFQFVKRNLEFGE
jgi:hypothetical protein